MKPGRRLREFAGHATVTVVWVLLCCFHALSAQGWEQMGGDLNLYPRSFYEDKEEDRFYMGGNFYRIHGTDSLKGIAYWDGTDWQQVGSGLDWPVWNITKYRGEIYATNNEVYRLDSITMDWVFVDSVFNASVQNLIVTGDTLWATGLFTRVKGDSSSGIAWFDGSDWHTWDSTAWNFHYMSSIVWYKGELYLGGNFYSSTLGIDDLAKWNGMGWEKVGAGLFGGLSGVGDMVVYKEELYVSGTFSQTESSLNPGNYIARWDGQNWHSVGCDYLPDTCAGGVVGLGWAGNGQIHDMKIMNDELWVAGVFQYAGGITAQRIAKWDGRKWCGMGTVFENNVVAIATYHDTLIIGGGFKTINGDSIRYVARWTGDQDYTDTCEYIPTPPALDTKVYPTLSSGTFFWDIRSNPDQLPLRLEVFDLTGKLVLSADALQENRYEFPVPPAAGIYAWRVWAGGQVAVSGKAVWMR